MLLLVVFVVSPRVLWLTPSFDDNNQTIVHQLVTYLVRYLNNGLQCVMIFVDFQVENQAQMKIFKLLCIVFNLI